jgi:hypothetical protein
MVLSRTSNDGLYNSQAHGFLVRRDQALIDMGGGEGQVTSARFRGDKPDVDRVYSPTTLVLDEKK